MHVPIVRLSPEIQKTWITHVTHSNDFYFKPRRMTVAAEELKAVRGTKHSLVNKQAGLDLSGTAARPAKT